MSLIAVVLLIVAVALVAVAEWPRLAERLGLEGWQVRRREKRKSHLRLITTPRQREPDTDLDLDAPEPADDFAASVQRDLENLPVVDPHDDRS